MASTIITAVAGLPGLITAIGGLFLHRQNAAIIADLHQKIAANASLR